MLETPDEFRRRIGRIEFGASHELQSRGDAIGHFVLAVALVSAIVGGALWLLWPWLVPLYIGLPAFAVYCALAYFVRVRPNHDHDTQRRAPPEQSR